MMCPAESAVAWLLSSGVPSMNYGGFLMVDTAITKYHSPYVIAFIYQAVISKIGRAMP